MTSPMVPAAAGAALLMLAAVTPGQAQTSFAYTNSTVTGFETKQSYSDSRIAPQVDPTAARDGCTNVPGVAHSSSDCTTITWMDPNTVLPDKPLDQLTGAEENLIRSYNILVRGPQKGVPQARASSFNRR